MALIDGIILGAIVVGFLIIGLVGETKTDTTADYFLAGRKLKWYQIGFSLFATNFSASALIGITGAAYITGIAIYNYEWVGIFALIFFALFLVAVIRGSRVYTIAEYLTERYDGRVKVLYSVFVIFLIVFIDMAGSLYAGGLLLSELVPGLSSHVVIVLVMVIVGLYSVLGGLKAITKTDMVQSIVLMVGAFLIAYYSIEKSGGWHGFVASTSGDDLSLIRGLDDRAVPWTGLLTGIPVLCAYFWLTSQNMVQWVLSAQTQSDARRGLLFAGFLKLPILCVVVIPGVAAASLIPGLAEPDRIYPAMLLELLPAGVLGLVLAGFVAALMSNTDSTLHAASTIITMDFVRRWKPGHSSQSLVHIGRIITIVIIGISALWAPMIGSFGTLFEYVQGLLSYAVAPFVVVYLGGIFWPRATSRGAIAALVTGFAAAVMIGVFSNSMETVNIHYLHVPLPITFLSLMALVVGSLSQPASPVEDRLLWRAQHKKDSLDRVGAADMGLAILLALLVIAQVILFK